MATSCLGIDGRKRTFIRDGIASVALVVTAAAYGQSPAPAEMLLRVDGLVVHSNQGDPLALAGGGMLYEGEATDVNGDWQVTWMFQVYPDPMQNSLVLGNAVFENLDDTEHAFEFELVAPVCPTVVDSSLLGALVQVRLDVGDNGGHVAVSAPDALWSACVDRGDVAHLFGSPFTLAGTGAGRLRTSADFGLPLPSFAGPAVSDSIGFRQTFRLSDGERVRFDTRLVMGADPASLAECAAPPSPDLTGDGRVDVNDMLELLGAWGDCPASAACPADLTGDDRVDARDLMIVFGAWG
jgi:hypothetical protein